MKMGTEFWAGHVAAARRETISASEYARRHGISVAALYYWQHKCRDTAVALSSKASTLARQAHTNPFVALHVLDQVNTSSCPCTLVLPSELRLEMSALPEPAWLIALMRAAQSSSGVR